LNVETLEILRCPYCGGRLDLVTSLFHRRTGDEIQDGVLGCQCCIFPVVDGIPVLHLQPAATTARDQIQAGRPDLARRTMVGLDDEAAARAFEAATESDRATYLETVEALGPNFEGGYFLYRFSDPTYIVAQAVTRAVGATVLGGSKRAIDICGGSGHVTRTLLELSTAPPVLADLFTPRSGSRAASRLRGASRCAAMGTPRCRLRAASSAWRCARTPSCSSGRSASS
jgi:uncharacterized protein YbaR (Trm112 family)